jgi:hypothetical protein
MTDGGTPLAIFGDLSKPVNTLIERVSDAVGGIAKPGQIIRVAKAEVKAEIIRAEGRVQITELERRALERMVREEGKKQENIESITAKAIPHVKTDAKPEDISADWLAHFFDRNRLTSDNDMQELWARVLAGEANVPGSFAKRTVDLVAALDKADAKLFTTISTCCWMMTRPTLCMLPVEAHATQKLGITFNQLKHLDAIGLVHFEPLSGYIRTKLPQETTFAYYGKHVQLVFPKDEFNLVIGSCLYTQAGEQLVSICGSTPSQSYLEAQMEKWMNEGVSVSAPIAEQSKQSWTRW